MAGHRRPRGRHWAALSSLAACATHGLGRAGGARWALAAFAAPGARRAARGARGGARGGATAPRSLRRAPAQAPALGGTAGTPAAFRVLLAAAAGRALSVRRRAADGGEAAQTAAAVKEPEPFFEEVQGDDPVVIELEERLRRQNGNPELTLDMVLNPGTIVNVEREVILLRAELKATPEEEVGKRKELEDKIEAKQMKIVNEMRQVMTDSLKAEFLIQALLNVVLCGLLCYEQFPFLPDLTWAGLNDKGTVLIGKLYGIWGIWLTTVPALRARKPGGPYGMGYEEKRALDLSFLVLPFICILTPFASRDPAATFWACLATLAGLYAWSFTTPLQAASGPRRGAGGELPEPVQWALRALDFGTGEERGARREDTTWQDQLASYEREAERLAAAKEKAKKKVET